MPTPTALRFAASNFHRGENLVRVGALADEAVSKPREVELRQLRPERRLGRRRHGRGHGRRG